MEADWSNYRILPAGIAELAILSPFNHDGQYLRALYDLMCHFNSEKHAYFI